MENQMVDKVTRTITALEHTIHVLEEENSQLAERAEDSLLLSLISENIQNLSDEIDIILNTLEQVSILKSIPFVTCGELSGRSLQRITSYSAFTDQEEAGYPITVEQDILDELQYGPFVTHNARKLTSDFNEESFIPTTCALIPFTTQVIEQGVFIFIDNTSENDRLSPMLMLLNHVVEMVVAKVDNLYLLKALSQANTDLEIRVSERTAEWIRANAALESEIVERTSSAQALKDSHETFLTVLNSIDATVYVADINDHTILFMNKNMIDTFGQDFTGKVCYKSFRGEAFACGICTNNLLVDADGKPTGLIVWEGKNPITGKSYINYDRAIKWTNGRLVKLQIATDITQLKSIETQLRQSQQFEAIGTLAGGIAHDFNNLLMGIQGRASLISTELELGHPHTEHIKAIEEYIRSAADLTSQLLGLAQGGKYEIRPVDINVLLIESSAMFGRTKKEIRIFHRLEEPPPIISADQRQIEQVLLNLYINAWQAMPNGGEMYIESKTLDLDTVSCKMYQLPPGRYARISVTDTGVGIEESTRQKIFDPFFTTKQKGRGTGLGLASAYGIIKNHSGRITVYSELNQGTTFNIYLPTTDEEIRGTLPMEEEVVSGAETVLLVDDEPMITEVGQAMLENLGYHVLIAEGGEQAVQTVTEKGDSIDLVVMDLVMPGMDGNRAFDLIRKQYPKMPIILSSGYSIDGQAAEVMRKGCNGFIQKPFNLSDLSRKVREVLEEGNSTVTN